MAFADSIICGDLLSGSTQVRRLFLSTAAKLSHNMPRSILTRHRRRRRRRRRCLGYFGAASFWTKRWILVTAVRGHLCHSPHALIRTIPYRRNTMERKNRVNRKHGRDHLGQHIYVCRPMTCLRSQITAYHKYYKGYWPDIYLPHWLPIRLDATMCPSRFLYVCLFIGQRHILSFH